MNTLSTSNIPQYAFYLLVMLLGGIGVKLGVATIDQIAYLLGGLGIGHATGVTTGVTNAVKSALASNGATTHGS